MRGPAGVGRTVAPLVPPRQSHAERGPHDVLLGEKRDEGTMKPTKYELFKRDDGSVVLRAHSPEAVQGYFNVEIVKSRAAYLPGLREHAEHLAARWGVPFEDKTAR